MFRNLIALLSIAVLTSGCATSNCAGWRQINPSRNDVLTEGTAKQILGHNEFGERQDCWKPGGGNNR